MAEESKRITEDWKRVSAKKPSTTEELADKAKKYIMKKAEEANGKPLDDEK